MKLVWLKTWVGVPHIDPFEVPNTIPVGSVGEISQLSGVDPEVCPEIGCIWIPSTSSMLLVGKDSVIPFPTIHKETSVLADPPELLAQTV